MTTWYEDIDDLLAFLRTDEGLLLLEEATDDELEEIELLLSAEVRNLSWREDLARPEQLEPGSPGSFSDSRDWLVWAIIAGRGFGKTRSGAEWAKELAEQYPRSRIALVAETFGAGRDDMVEGESGLLNVIEPHKIARWNRSLGELKMTNGSQFRVFSSERPGALRGPQHHFAWCDEVAKWRDAHVGAEDDTTWSNMLFGLRLGVRPRICVTTTPKPVLLLKGTKEKPGILFEKGTVISSGSTFENLSNLAPTFRDTVVARYEGSRLGRQELYAELLDDVEGALWSTALIDEHRCDPGYPTGDGGGIWRIVVGVDPSTGDGSKDLCGIVVAGRAADGRVYVLEDMSIAADPDGWAKQVVYAFDKWAADAVVAEANQGNQMVSSVLRTRAPGLPITLVQAKRGKYLRAEPISALYQQGKVWHAGRFDELEEQMTIWTPDSKESPDRLDALGYAVWELMPPGGAVGSFKARDTSLKHRR